VELKAEKKYYLPVTVKLYPDPTAAECNQICLLRLEDGQMIETYSGNLKEVAIEVPITKAVTVCENKVLIPDENKGLVQKKKGK
jgi:hypothetical protein